MNKIYGVAAAAFYLFACSRSGPPPAPPAISLADGAVAVDAAGPFARRLKLETVPASEQKFSLRVIGQILALANPSGALQGAPVSWTELDPALTKSVGLHLPTNSAALVGTAYGSARVPEEYFAQIKVGHPVEISHYGLGSTHLTGRIIAVRPVEAGQDGFEVVFALSSASDWYPGLNCELQFPLFQVHSVRIPQVAILHEGNREFVFVQTSASHFRPVPVVVVSEGESRSEVMGISPQNSIVTEGAILLKPEIHRLVKAAEEITHAP